MAAQTQTYLKVFAVLGWVLVVGLVATILPRFIKRGFYSTPATRRERWEETLNQRIQQIQPNTWQDMRPLHIFAGDSQIEFGNWYDLYCGRYSIRNCGLSSATIEDVIAVVQSIPDQNAECLVLLCGINDILRGRSIDQGIRSYQILLSTAIATSRYKSIKVVSVLPIHKSWPNQTTDETNLKITEFNARLSKICHTRHVGFLDHSASLATPQGPLEPDLTRDGLHLNDEGYRRLSKLMEPEIFGIARN